MDTVLHLDLSETHVQMLFICLFCVLFLKLAILWFMQFHLQLVDFLNCRLCFQASVPLCSQPQTALYARFCTVKHPHHQIADYTTVIGLINSSYEPPRRNKPEKSHFESNISKSGVCKLLRTSWKVSHRVFTLVASSSCEFKDRTRRTLKGVFTKQPASYQAHYRLRCIQNSLLFVAINVVLCVVCAETRW